MQWSLRCSVLLLRNLCAAADGCWAECGRSGYYCPEFCCQPTDGGNPSCWDEAGIYTFSKCCTQVTFGPDVDLYFQLGQVLLPLYRGPSEHNSPKVNERTLEVALGLWYMRRSLREGKVPIEIGNVLSNYWPKDDYLQATSADSSAMLRYLPWHLADLEYGQDATTLSFQDSSVLSISTVEHVGHDNEGLGGSLNGFRSDGSLQSLEDWVRSWNQAPELLQRIAALAQSFLVTFPIGLNVRLDDVVSSNAWLRNHSRIVRRVNAQNLWQVDPDFPQNPSAFHKYHYDLRDAYWPDTIGLMFHPQLPAIYEQIYGHAMRPRLRPPQHPRFRFANAVCVVTNVPELLA